jgi:NHLM bacteriocin system ABC transporter ATP-binding protein
MATARAHIADIGEVETPVSNRPFFLDDPDSVWVVKAGSVDLFLTATRERKPVGARRHVLRVRENHAVFGIGPSPRRDRALFATVSPGGTLIRTTLAAITEQIASDGNPLLQNWLEEWIDQLYSALNRAGPRVFGVLEPGVHTIVSEDTQPMLPRQGVVWVSHRKGVSLFLGSQELPFITGPRPFPVAKHGWLEPRPESVLSTIDTRTLAEVDPLGLGLQEFHRIVMFAILLEAEKENERHRARSQAKEAASASLVGRALLQLTTPLKKGRPAVGFDRTICDDPVFIACQAVGRNLNIELKPHPDMLRGIPLRDPVASIAKASGLRVRQVALKAGWWKQDLGPLVAFRDSDESPVALLPRSPGKYDFSDPITKQSVPLTPELADTLNPFAYVFYRPFPPSKLSKKDLLWFGLQGCQREFLTIVLMGMAGGALGIAIPYALGIVFDSLIPGAERHQLVQMALVLTVCALASAMFALTSSFAMLRLEGRMDASLQAAVWDRLLSLPVPFFRNYTAGDLAVRSLAINQIRQALTGTAITSIMTGIFSIFSYALLFYYDWHLALLATALVGVAFVITASCAYLQVRYQREIFQVRGRLSGMVLQFVTGIAKLRVSGTERQAFAAWGKEFARQKQVGVQARKVSNGLSILTASFPVICMIAIFYYNGTTIIEASGTPLRTGNFLAFIAAFTQFLTATLVLSSSVVSVLTVVPLYERAQPIFQTLPEVTLAKASPGKLAGGVEVSHVNFRYHPSMPLVLDDLSISIRPGQYVAIVGSSGCGKSTLFRLLLGFETPESGSIYYDGQDLAHLDVLELRRQMGVVLQSGRLVSGDIFTNIVGSAKLTLEDAWEAARLAGIDEDISRMPMGMHTVIGESGGGMSGGQKQRLLIARAIVHRPSILLFDEATSALDNQTQAVVSRSLESLQATRVVIAHRLSTIIKADRIFVMDKGTVVQSGSYDDLLSQEGLFRELARRQLV